MTLNYKSTKCQIHANTAASHHKTAVELRESGYNKKAAYVFRLASKHYSLSRQYKFAE